jgi:hypothetical protein
MEGAYTACIVMLLSFVVYVSFFDVKRVGQDIGIGQGEEPEAAPASAAPVVEKVKAIEAPESAK